MDHDLQVDFNALGQAMDTTFTRSSTPQASNYSVKFSLNGNLLTATYSAIVTFHSVNDMVRVKKNYADEATSITNDAIKRLKEVYKSLSDEKLKLSEVSDDDTIEVINTSFVNPKKTAYFRRKTVFEVG